MSGKRVKAIYELKVVLLGIDPPIWRRVPVPEDTKLPGIHRILQLLFNWEDYHPHDFIAGRRAYSVPDPDDALYGRKVADERLVPLNRILRRVGETMEYVYDFGDSWRHLVRLEAILLPSPGASYPRCVAGERNGPPEDAGGPYGYAAYLEALANPHHPEHENMLAWRGPFDPEAFSLDAVNSALAKAFRRRKAPAKAAWSPPRNPGSAKTRVASGTPLPLELTDEERELVLKKTFAPDDLTRRLRIVPPRGAPAVIRYSLEELDELAGYVAAESNHAKSRKLQRQWEAIYTRIAAILESFTDQPD